MMDVAMLPVITFTCPLVINSLASGLDSDNDQADC